MWRAAGVALDDDDRPPSPGEEHGGGKAYEPPADHQNGIGASTPPQGYGTVGWRPSSEDGELLRWQEDLEGARGTWLTTDEAA
jgi:hypothetical protein